MTEELERQLKEVSLMGADMSKYLKDKITISEFSVKLGWLLDAIERLTVLLERKENEKVSREKDK